MWVIFNHNIIPQGTTILQDNLQGSTIGLQVGGTFTSEGYRPGIGLNHILYDVPSQVVNGYIEFEMKGFSPSLIQDPNGGNDADNGFFGMYDGRGITEPIPYFDDFKYNYFRWNFHWRQNNNSVKSVISCAAPTPERLNSTYAVFSGGGALRDWYSEPNGIFYSFDPSLWYTVRCEWDNLNFVVKVNGTTVWSTSGPYDYAPIDFKIWLGSAPGYDDKYGNFVQNTTYRNFKVVSYGTQNTAPNIFSTPVTSGSVGQLYSYDVNASGNPTPTYSLTTSPSGMTINSNTGLIQWTPASTGSYNVTVTASNGVTPDASQSFTINVQNTQNSAPVITTAPVTSVVVGQLYSYDVNASGNPLPTFSLTTSPSGMTINSTTGLIQWTPSATGNFNVTVKAANGVTPDATQSFSLLVRDSQSGDCPPSIISYWKLDETSGSTFNDFIGTSNASSTNIPSPISGRVNGAQQFNGTSNRITAPVNAAYNWSANSSFTFEAWIKHPTSSNPGKEVIIGRKATNSQLSIWFGFDLSNEIEFSVRSKTGENFLITGPNLFDNEWHHVVGVKDGSLNQLRLYVDGVLVNTISTSYSSGFDSPTATMSIGWRDIAGDERFFSGVIDEVAVYGSALEANLISQHYGFGLQNKGYCEPPVAPTITSSAITSGTVGQLYTYDVQADGVPAPTFSLVTFPSGMSINANTGVIEWAPLVVGNYNVTIKAANGVSPDATQSYVLQIQADTAGTCLPTLVSYWKLNETSGTTYADFVGANNGSSTNPPTPVTGQVDGAQQFNGTSNGIVVPPSTGFDWEANSSFTIEAWIKHPAVPYTNVETIVNRKSTTSGLSIQLAFNSTSIRFQARSNSNENYNATGTSNLYDGNWHHVVGVKDGNSNQLRVYVDGILENTTATNYTSGFDSPTAQLSIGYRPIAGEESYFNGIIDEVAVYSSALDTGSISKHYTNGLANRSYCNVLASLFPPIITSTPITTGIVDQLYSYDVNATGTPTPSSYSLITKPSGMTINSSTGLIQWTPTIVGNFNVTVRVSNGVSPNALQSFTISVQLNPNDPCQPTTISYWKLDETSGSSYNDFVGGITADASTINKPTPVPGQVNGAQLFNGISNAITVPSNTVFDWSASSSFTFEAWIKHPAGLFIAEEIIIGRKSATTPLSLKLSFTSTSVAFGVRSRTNENYTVTGTSNLFDGNWHHVVGVKDAAANRLRIFVDGVREGSLHAPFTGGFDAANTDLTIGWRNVAGQESYFNGTIDEVAIYNSALDSLTILQHYTKGLVNLGYCDNPIAPVITSTPSASIRVGELYSYDVNATGTPIPKYLLVTAPFGMTIDSLSGLIQWNPTIVGDTTVTVQASNGIIPNANQTFTVTVLPQPTPPVIISMPDTTGTTGQLYTYDVNATGDPTPTFSLVSAPSGMTINTNTGVIQWTPTTPGVYSVTVEAVNGISPNATQSFNINVQLQLSAPVITSTPILTAIRGQLYAYDVNANGNPIPTYSLTTFPSGMTINQSSGVIQWTPAATGSYNVSVVASNGIAPDATQSYQINVVESVPCAPGIISYWKLNESSGTVYDDFVSSNSATSSNAPTPIVGRVNGGQQFNGTSNRISAPHSTIYDFALSTSFTFEAWIKHPTGSYTSEEIVLERKPASGALTINLKFNSKKITFLARSNASEIFFITGTTELFDNNWHHVVGVRDASNNQLRVYVDGVLEGSVSATYSQGFTSTNAPIGIGFRASDNSSFFKGAIDEVAIYNTALSPAAILQHYNNGLVNLGYCDISIAPTIVSDPSTATLVNQLYAYDVNAVGNPAPTFSLTTFPSGMTINNTTGVIQWTPTSVGNYNVVVNAINGVNPNAVQSFTINVQSPVADPANLQAVLNPPSNRFVSLTWVDNASNELGYILERKNGDTLSVNPYLVIDSVAANQSVYLDTTVDWLTTYSYRVKAYNLLMSSGYSNQASVSTPPAPIAAPTFLTASLFGSDLQFVQLHWVDNSSNELGFIIQRKSGDSTVAAPFVSIDSVDENITSFVDSTVMLDSIYRYRVFAYNANSVSDFSNLADIRVPVELTAFNVDMLNSSIILQWETATETNNAGFSIQRSKDNIKFTDIAFVKGSGTTTSKSVYSYIDKSALTGKYYYRLKQMDYDGKFWQSKVVEIDLGLPKSYSIEQNYPNPFNPSTTLRFSLPLNSNVTIKLYNALGQEVANILNADLEAGIHETVFDASNLASGVYFYNIKARGTNGSSFTSTKRMILMK